MGWFRDAKWKRVFELADQWWPLVESGCDYERMEERIPDKLGNRIADLSDELTTLIRQVAPTINPEPIWTIGQQMRWRWNTVSPIPYPEALRRLTHNMERARYIGMLLRNEGTVSKEPTPEVVLPNDARYKWAYDQFTRQERGAMVTQAKIMARLKTKCAKLDWTLCDITTLKRDANRWAMRNGKPQIAKRKHGRPTNKR